MEDKQLLRYSRQILLPEVDITGQERLLASCVLIIGMGGLGCPAGLYLAAAGIGHLVFADADTVELSNLQRQIAFDSTDIGQPKVEAAARRFRGINPDIRLSPIQSRLEGDCMEQAIIAADAVLDCSDNFATRFAVNRSCVRHGKPLVSGAVIRLEGQLAVYDPRHQDSPCYQCLFPEEGQDDNGCSRNGVITPLPGIIGSLQALEAMKILLDDMPPSHGKLLLYDAARLSWHSVQVRRNPDCPACGQRDRF